MNNFESKLYSFNSSPNKDSTIDVTFVIHDFELSGNGQVITEEVCKENMATLLNKPILAKYYSLEEEYVDHLGDHEVSLTINRDTGDWMATTNTVAIGVCTKVYLGEVEGRRCLLADGKLWSDRYYNTCSLLYEWNAKGVRTLSSCEYLYSNYEVKDGIQYVKSDIIYEGITVLNSEQRGDYDVVQPAYSSSHMLKFSVNENLNKAICQDINKNNLGEGDEIVEEIKETIEVVEPEVTTEKALNEEVTIEPIMETVAETQEEVAEDKVEEVTEEEEKESAEEETTETDKLVELEDQLKVAVERIEALETELNEAKSLNTKLDEQVTSLNTIITDLNVYKERYEAEEYEKALNERKEAYAEKFAKFGAMDKFESEEVQELIAKTLNSQEEKEARLAISEMLLDLGMSSLNEKKPAVEETKVVELTTSLNNLIPTTDKFKENYGFSYK